MNGAIRSLAIIIFSIISINCLHVNAANSSTTEPPVLQRQFSALANLASGLFDECHCYTRSNCIYQGGIAYGSCGGYNYVCCLIMKTCGSVASTNLSSFTNPNYPMPYYGGNRCAITIPKINNNICQVRLDLLDFSIYQPTSEGICDSDFLLIISGSTAQVPRICGENSGQHLYVNFQDSTPVTLYVVTDPDQQQSRRWNIQISQIECNSPAKAPSGCLQYHTSESGTITSFNYGRVNNPRLTASGAVGTREIASLNYGICIRVADNYCSLRWSETESNSFTVSGDASTATSAAASGASCKGDYVIIPDPSENNVKTNADRYCGTKFNPKTTSLKPFALYVVTDNTETTAATPDVRNRGFSLNYKQLICSL